MLLPSILAPHCLVSPGFFNLNGSWSANSSNQRVCLRDYDDGQPKSRWCDEVKDEFDNTDPNAITGNSRAICAMFVNTSERNQDDNASKN